MYVLEPFVTASEKERNDMKTAFDQLSPCPP